MLMGVTVARLEASPGEIVERSHLDCRKPVRRSFRFNRVTGNQDRHCSVCVGRGALPFHRAKVPAAADSCQNIRLSSDVPNR